MSRRKKELTGFQKRMIETWYKQKKEMEICKDFGITRMQLQQHKRAKGLFKYPENIKKHAG